MNCHVKPIVIIGKDEDGSYQSPCARHNKLEDLKQKVCVSLKLLQVVTSSLLDGEDFTDRQFAIDQETATNEISVFRSRYCKSELQSMGSDILWENLAREVYHEYIKKSKYELKVIGFLTCTEYLKIEDGGTVPETYGDVLKRTKGYVMCGIGGFALVGCGNLYTWASSVEDVAACLRCVEKIDRQKFQDESNMRGTWGACYSSALGSVLHELFHLFDLIHASEGIMGSGFVHIDQFILRNLPNWFPELSEKSEGSVRHESCDICNIKEATSSHQGTDLVCDSLSDCNLSDEKRFFLDRPSLVTLAFHRFLNLTEANSAVIQRFGTSVNSPAGIRLVALRDNDRTVKHWEFLKNPPPKVFTVPTILCSATLVVFVVDNAGNTATFDWNRQVV